MNARVGRFALLAFAAAAGACAVVLGIEDRVLDVVADDAMSDGATDAGDGSPDVPLDDGASTDAPFEVSLIADAACDPSACALIPGGSCEAGACQIACGAGCAGSVIDCPANTDCQILCENKGCAGARCRGGRSCTFECSGGNCVGAACESPDCTFRCGAGACGNVSCDAGVSCLVDCLGNASCDVSGGIRARAGETCTIRCTGQTSCGGGSPSGVNSPIWCDAPDASILCGAPAVTDACKDGIPTCTGGQCTVNCVGADACEDGYCCEAGVCNKLGTVVTKLCN